MRQEDVFIQDFLYRRVLRGRRIFKDGRTELRVSEGRDGVYLYLWNYEPERRTALVVGYSYPDGRVWILQHELTAKLNRRSCRKLGCWLKYTCHIVVANDREQVWRIKPCTIKSVIGSSENGAAFGDRLVSKYGVEQ